MKKYIGIFISVFLLVIVGNSIYTQINKKPISAKAKRLPCQKITTSFEKAFDKDGIKKGQLQLEAGNFKFTSYVEKSIYMKSRLFKYVKLSQMDAVTLKELQKYKINDIQTQDKLRVLYYIYENDKSNPGKKTKKSKIYEGYVVFKFFNINNKLIYQAQIDFMNNKGSDIPQKIKCAIKSFATYNK